MSDIHEYEYVSEHLSPEKLSKWIEIHEPWRLEGIGVNFEFKKNEQIYNEKEVYALNKDKQIEILNSFGIKDIPRYEKDRVDKILEIQGGK